MPYSDNGWPVLDNSATHRRVTLQIGGVSFSVLKEAQAEFRALLTMLNKLERFSLYGYDGGFYRRPIAGSNVWSTHASGTGVDVNAARHVQGVRNSGWSLKQRLYIYAWLKVGVGRCFKWGNDFQRTPDPMHFQLRDPDTFKRYRFSPIKAAAKDEAVARVQAVIGVKADGILGPTTQAQFVQIRRACQVNRLAHPKRIAAVQRAVGVGVRKSPIWGKLTDAALGKLGFDVSHANTP